MPKNLVIVESPAKAKTIGKQAMAKFLKNDFAGASELFQQAIELDPSNNNKQTINTLIIK